MEIEGGEGAHTQSLPPPPTSKAAWGRKGGGGGPVPYNIPRFQVGKWGGAEVLANLHFQNKQIIFKKKNSTQQSRDRFRGGRL